MPSTDHNTDFSLHVRTYFWVTICYTMMYATIRALDPGGQVFLSLPLEFKKVIGKFIPCKPRGQYKECKKVV